MYNLLNLLYIYSKELPTYNDSVIHVIIKLLSIMFLALISKYANYYINSGMYQNKLKIQKLILNKYFVQTI